MIAEKRDKPYSKMIHWICCRLGFLLLRLAIMCIRGSRSTPHCPAGPSIINNMDHACSEGWVLGVSQDYGHSNLYIYVSGPMPTAY